jgi:flagellar biosynthetic protein FliP
VCVVGVPASPVGAAAAPSGAATAASSRPADLGKMLPDLTNPAGTATIVRWILLATVLSLAPAIVILVTCFTRIVVVLGLLRQALATQQLPPNQILFGLAILMTLVLMAPVYGDVNRDCVRPYLSGTLPADEALRGVERHIRSFMIRQIEGGRNEDDVYLFLAKDVAARRDLSWSDVPTLSLIPAFVTSELKIAFMIGFRIFLPFLVIDMLVAAVLTSMGMLMLPPVLISMPFKLLLFVLADGWHLVVGTLMKSFG